MSKELSGSKKKDLNLSYVMHVKVNYNALGVNCSKFSIYVSRDVQVCGLGVIR